MEEAFQHSKGKMSLSSERSDFANPKFILNQIAEYIKSGDIDSTTDLISAYINNCPKYQNQSEFAQAIGTNCQTLIRRSANENVSINIYFNAIQRIYLDSLEC